MMWGYGPDWMGYGFGHWVIFIVCVVVFIYPIGRILGRVGFSPFWAILAFIPFVNLIALWVLAFIDWPQQSSGSST